MAVAAANSTGALRVLAFTALGTLLFIAAAAAKATYTTFLIDGAVPQIFGINNSNTVVGNASPNGFLRTAEGTITTFAVPGAKVTQALTINDIGSVAGVYLDSSGKAYGFLRAADGTITTFGVRRANGTEPYAINGQGEIAGVYDDDIGSHSFVRTAGGRIRTFNAPGAIDTRTYGLNDHGVSVGYYIDNSDVYHGFFRSRDGTITTIDVPGALGTMAGYINNQGTVTGWYGDGHGGYGFIRATDGGITTFALPDCDIGPAGINRKGVITGECRYRANPQHVLGFIRHPDGKLQLFHVPNDGPHTEPRAINDSGAIAGDYLGGGFLRFP